MKLVIQRVTEASVSVDGELKGEIGKGLMVLLGVGKEDTGETVRKYADKLLKLRIFEDENGKTNLSLADVGGELLIVSQFTLYADCRSNRPGFSGAGAPELARQLYDEFLAYCEGKAAKVAGGVFGADMKVALVNDGPFTIVL